MVSQVVAFDRLEIVVELVNERNTGRDVEFENLFLGEVVEIHYKGAEAVSMRCNDHALAGLHRRRDFFVPERQEAIDGVLEALGERELGLGNTGVAGVVTGPALVRFFKWGWGNIIAPTPHEHLFIAKLRGGLGFVEALERPIVTLVEAPVFFHRNPQLVEFREHSPECVEGPLQHRDIGNVEDEAIVFKDLSSSFRLGAASVTEFDVVPTRESVFFVPGAFAVADEDKFVHEKNSELVLISCDYDIGKFSRKFTTIARGRSQRAKSRSI